MGFCHHEIGHRVIVLRGKSAVDSSNGGLLCFRQVALPQHGIDGLAQCDITDWCGHWHGRWDGHGVRHADLGADKAKQGSNQRHEWKVLPIHIFTDLISILFAAARKEGQTGARLLDEGRCRNFGQQKPDARTLDILVLRRGRRKHHMADTRTQANEQGNGGYSHIVTQRLLRPPSSFDAAADFAREEAFETIQWPGGWKPTQLRKAIVQSVIHFEHPGNSISPKLHTPNLTQKTAAGVVRRCRLEPRPGKEAPSFNRYVMRGGIPQFVPVFNSNSQTWGT